VIYTHTLEAPYDIERYIQKAAIINRLYMQFPCGSEKGNGTCKEGLWQPKTVKLS